MMLRYLVRRFLLLLLTLFLSSALIFSLTQLLPGDVARLVLGRDAQPEAIAQFNERFGLNDPAPVQYVRWLVRFATGDWGRSYTAGNPDVRSLVTSRLANSALLAAFTLIVAVPVAIGLGILAALNQGSWIDGLISFVSLSAVGLPEFVTGILLINIFALGLGWFETASLIREGYQLGDWLRILTLPMLTASFVLIGYITRMARAGMIDELKRPYVRTAVLKGLPYRVVILRHVLRNALLPTITVIAISIGWLMGGLVVIETIFNYPGLGSEMVRAVTQKNLPVLQSIAMIIVLIFALSNLVADLLYALLNPRIRFT